MPEMIALWFDWTAVVLHGQAQALRLITTSATQAGQVAAQRYGLDWTAWHRVPVGVLPVTTLKVWRLDHGR